MVIAYKIKYIAIWVCIFALLITVRLFQLQIWLNKPFILQGEKNFLRWHIIPAPRGDLIDRNGIALATNRPIFSLCWQGTGKYSLTPEHRALLNTIESILEKPIDEELLKKIVHAERRSKTVVIAYDLSFIQLSKIEEQCMGNGTIAITTSFKRYYPYDTMASHVIGYVTVTDNDVSGKTGLEKILDDCLKGQDGLTQHTINSFGSILSQKEIKKPTPGTTVRLTIDSAIQRICQQVFPIQRSGAFVVMDPEDGSILALVSRPDFSPNLFLNPITMHDWQELQEKKPFLNRAIHAAYPPGSVFKLVTVSAALEHGITEPEALWNCKGFVRFGNRKYWCMRHYGHGLISTQQGLALSCNTVFYELAKQLHIDTIADYAYRFGLGQQTGVILSDQAGLVPNTHWKSTYKGERWWPGETLSVVIGQSFLLATPLQIARFIASIFTGYLVKPRILMDELIETQPLMIQESTNEFLRQSMKSVVTTGTGQRVSKITDLEVYAKTSTAQTKATDHDKPRSKQEKNEHDPYLEHGWIVGHCRYKNSKPITFVIVIEHAGSSRVATDVAKNFLLAYKQHMDLVIKQ